MLKNIFYEEDMFPRFFTGMSTREYGYLFYDAANKESFDSNHALIYQQKISCLESVLKDIISFYDGLGIIPHIYQATEDEGYFSQNSELFKTYGFRVWDEGPNKFMILEGENNITPTGKFDVRLLDKWDTQIEENIFIAAGEPWEIDVAKQTYELTNGRVFVAYYEMIPVGISYIHLTDKVCRYDYILVNPEYRGMGCARDILFYMANYCVENKVKNCFQWPAHKTSERICYEAGFRVKCENTAGRASR